MDVLSALFRPLFLAKLRAAYQAGELQFFGKHARLIDPRAFAAYLAPLWNTNWVVYCKRPFGGPKEVLRYLARYTHRVAISNRRLIACDDKDVTFKWKDYRREGRDPRDPRVHPPLSHARAARRLPSHPLLWPARQRQARRQHRSCPRTAHAAYTSRRCHQSSGHQRRGTAKARAFLPHCGGRMIIIERFERGSTPHYHPSPPTPVIRIDTS